MNLQGGDVGTGVKIRNDSIANKQISKEAKALRTYKLPADLELELMSPLLMDKYQSPELDIPAC
jgi:hypothetical protein